MSISDANKAKLNRESPACRDAQLGTEIQNLGNRVSTVQAHSVAVDAAGLVADFNALIDKLKAAGLMASS